MSIRTPEELAELWTKVEQATFRPLFDGDTRNDACPTRPWDYKKALVMYAEILRSDAIHECICRISVLQQNLGGMQITNPSATHEAFIRGVDAARAAIEEITDAQSNV